MLLQKVRENEKKKEQVIERSKYDYFLGLASEIHEICPIYINFLMF